MAAELAGKTKSQVYAPFSLNEKCLVIPHWVKFCFQWHWYNSTVTLCCWEQNLALWAWFCTPQTANKVDGFGWVLEISVGTSGRGHGVAVELLWRDCLSLMAEIASVVFSYHIHNKGEGREGLHKELSSRFSPTHCLALPPITQEAPEKVSSMPLGWALLCTPNTEAFHKWNLIGFPARGCSIPAEGGQNLSISVLNYHSSPLYYTNSWPFICVMQGGRQN